MGKKVIRFGFKRFFYVLYIIQEGLQVLEIQWWSLKNLFRCGLGLSFSRASSYKYICITIFLFVVARFCFISVSFNTFSLLPGFVLSYFYNTTLATKRLRLKLLGYSVESKWEHGHRHRVGIFTTLLKHLVSLVTMHSCTYCVQISLYCCLGQSTGSQLLKRNHLTTIMTTFTVYDKDVTNLLHKVNIKNFFKYSNLNSTLLI